MISDAIGSVVVSHPFRSDFQCNWALEVSVWLYRIRLEVISSVTGHYKCLCGCIAFV